MPQRLKSTDIKHVYKDSYVSINNLTNFKYNARLVKDAAILSTRISIVEMNFDPIRVTVDSINSFLVLEVAQ